jgi:FKBP-type peptidyl-prolyl cis-trans isomerase SlyD
MENVMKIDLQKVVTMSYELIVYGEDDSPHSLEKRDSQNPIEFVYGQGLILPAVEKQILGQTAGFKKSILLYPEEAYGLHKAELETWLDRKVFPKGTEIRVGMKFQTQGPGEEFISVLVKEIKEDQILIDGNHPLAGLKIQFDVEILRVRAATAEELASGEVKSRLH